SFGRLVAAMSVLFAVCLWSLFVDDFVIGGDPDAVIGNVKLLLFAMFACGFDTVCGLLATIGISLADELPVLGVSFRYVGDGLELQCNRATRLESVRDFLLSDGFLETSKSEIYSICGKLGFDPAKCHPECRAASDAMRALIGKAFNKQAWPDMLNLVTSLTPLQFVVYTGLVKWMRELIDDLKCSHVSECSLSGSIANLVLACDASRSGGGFLIVSSTKGGGDESDELDISSSP
ncbi:hypothetical protein FOZ63_012203, partial [Perkinsus olseni]